MILILLQNQKAGLKMMKEFSWNVGDYLTNVWRAEEILFLIVLLGSQIKYLAESAVEKKIDFLQSWQTIGKISHLFKFHYYQKILRKIQKLFRKIQNQIENNRNRVFLLTPARQRCDLFIFRHLQSNVI